MSDDEPDLELLELLRARFGINQPHTGHPETRVLENAEFIYNNSVDVAIDMRSTKIAAQAILNEMSTRSYSTSTWSEHELHPKEKNEATVNFIFTMDLLNFSFWSDRTDEEGKFGVVFRGKKWTGYWSLVALLQRALEQDVPITTPAFWIDEEKCTNDVLRTVFSSGTDDEIPLLSERMRILREAGRILDEEFDGSVLTLIKDANGSAAALVNLLADKFPCFRDEGTFDRKKVRFLKRAQIFVADMWAAFDGTSFGSFNDIDKITMFADYRIPQILHSLGVLWYCPSLEAKIRRKEEIESGHEWEMQIRGCSIWAVEVLRREIVKMRSASGEGKQGKGEEDAGGTADDEHDASGDAADGQNTKGEAGVRGANGAQNINAILIDFFLYDLAKEKEREAIERGREDEMIPHHRTRSIWY